MRIGRHRKAWASLLIVLFFYLGCGSGGSAGNGGGSGGGTADFTIALSVSTLTVASSGTGAVSVSATGSNGSSGTITVVPSGIPSGISISPQTAQITAGSAPAVFTFTSSSSAAAGSTNVLFTGTSGSLSHTASLALTVLAAPPPDFSIALSVSTLTILFPGTGTVSVSAAGSNGFSGSITVVPSGLPSGISISPQTAQITSGSAAATFTFTASSSVAAGSANVLFTGTSGSLSHSASLALALQAPPVSLGRTKYVRTDSVTSYGLDINPSWTTYDSATQRFFISDPDANLLRVMDAATEKQIAAIPVPGVYGIDFTPDHTVLYAGTQIGDVYAIDPVAMQVTHRYLQAHIGPAGFGTRGVRVLANGSLMLLGASGGIPSVDGFGDFAIWNVQTNSINVYVAALSGTTGPLPYPETAMCPASGAWGVALLSGDRQQIITASIDSDATICSFNPTTGSTTSTTGPSEFIHQIVATPDGASVVTIGYSPNRVVVLDAKTLAQKTSFNVSADTSSAGNLFVSNDSQTVYLSSGSQIFAYNLTSGAMTGWMPAPLVQGSYGGLLVGSDLLPVLGAEDGTGLIAGPMEEGVGFVDTATLRTGAVGSSFTNAYLTPATGPVTGGTATSWQGVPTGSAKITSVNFGPNAATAVGSSSSGAFATTPAGTAGPADVYSFASDGGVQIIPEAFSYGPTILEVTPDSSTAEGGGTGIVYGYGFTNAGDTTLPSGLQVSVGGTPVTITSFTPNAYGALSPPFLLQALAFTIPAGVSGTSAAVTVTTSAGSATAPAGLKYLPAIQQIALSGASLAQGIYDSHRNLFYFSDTNSIRVFSRSTQTWLTPFTLSGSNHRLWAMGLSPDGSKLVVSDPPTGSVYLFDPSGVAAPKSFPVQSSTTAYATQAAGVAVSNAGIVYFGRTVAISGASSLSRLDLNTGNVTEYPSVGSSGLTSDLEFHIAISSDNSRVYFNDDGQMLYIDTATNTVTYTPVGDGCCYGDYDLHLAINQTSLEATSFLYDGDEDGDAALTLNLREAANIEYVYGTAFSPDGSLLFQPSTQGIDVFDGHVGTLRTRIALPVALGQNYDALVAGGPDDQVVAITGATGTGIALIDLTSLTEPGPLQYVASARRGIAEPATSSTYRLGSLKNHGRVAKFQVPHRSLPPPNLHWQLNRFGSLQYRNWLPFLAIGSRSQSMKMKRAACRTSTTSIRLQEANRRCRKPVFPEDIRLPDGSRSCNSLPPNISGLLWRFD